MTTPTQDIARVCLHAAETDQLSFPQILAQLASAGIESYAIDFRRSTATYYLPSGEFFELPTHTSDAGVAETFDSNQVIAAIREAQQQVPGYSYSGFCRKVRAAGCASYFVSLLGRRATYMGRTGETHVELFPGS